MWNPNPAQKGAARRSLGAVGVALALVQLCLGHPGVGIVLDANGNLYYTDLAQVWRIAPDGSRSIVVPGVHTHELCLDRVITQGVQTRTLRSDHLGRTVGETHPENGTTTALWDDGGRRIQVTDARGITTTTRYDVLNRPQVVDYSDATPDVTYAYDLGAYGIGRGHNAVGQPELIMSDWVDAPGDAFTLKRSSS